MTAVTVLVLMLSRLELVDGVAESGAATESWRQAVQRLDPGRNADDRKPATAPERAWRDLIRSRAQQWESETTALGVHFAPVKAPEVVRVVIGNQGGEDAFTADERTIGFDSSRLIAAYGDAGGAENSERIDRFFRHEYVHLLQKAWLREFPYDADTPLKAALLGMWLEGLGHYYSLSQRWRAEDGQLSDHAKRTLMQLEPRLLARLSALACATDEQGRELTADLSFGAFDQKWGALPVALWLEAEASRSADALHRFVKAGPDGIWPLAERHMPERERAMLREVRASAALCVPQ